MFPSQFPLFRVFWGILLLFFFVSHLGLRIVVGRGLPFCEGALWLLCKKVPASVLMRVKIFRLLFVYPRPHRRHHSVALKMQLLYREQSAGFAVGRQHQDP